MGQVPATPRAKWILAAAASIAEARAELDGGPAAICDLDLLAAIAREGEGDAYRALAALCEVAETTRRLHEAIGQSSNREAP